MSLAAREYYLAGKDDYIQRNFNSAVANFKKSIEVEPTAEAFCELAITHMENNKFAAAIEHLKTSIGLNERYPKSAYAMAVCYLRIKPANIKLARLYYKKAVELGYNVPEWFERHLERLEKR